MRLPGNDAWLRFAFDRVFYAHLMSFMWETQRKLQVENMPKFNGNKTMWATGISRRGSACNVHIDLFKLQTSRLGQFCLFEHIDIC